jgi:hypothetical protein
MRSRDTAFLNAVVHHLWRDSRILRSPILGIVAVIAVLTALLTLWQGRFSAVSLFLATRLPLIFTLGVISLAWRRVMRGGVARDWRLATNEPRDLCRAIFVTPWLVWLPAVCIANWTLLLFHPQIWTTGTGRSTALLYTPLTPVRQVYDPTESWGPISFRIYIILLPPSLFLLAIMMRWIHEALLNTMRNALVAFGTSSVIYILIRAALIHGLWRLQQMAADDLQHRFPSNWSLPARQQLGLYLVWLLFPASALVIAFVARRIALKSRSRWWQTVN